VAKEEEDEEEVLVDTSPTQYMINGKNYLERLHN